MRGAPDGESVNPTGKSSMDVAVTELNVDGCSDLVTATVVADTASVPTSTNGAGFLSHQESATGEDPLVITVADVNGEGGMDIEITNRDSATVSILLGNGNGRLDPPQETPIRGRPLRSMVLEIDNDGDLEPIAASTDANELKIVELDRR